jgi:hypothetical protein
MGFQTWQCQRMTCSKDLPCLSDNPATSAAHIEALKANGCSIQLSFVKVSSFKWHAGLQATMQKPPRHQT